MIFTFKTHLFKNTGLPTLYEPIQGQPVQILHLFIFGTHGLMFWFTCLFRIEILGRHWSRILSESPFPEYICRIVCGYTMQVILELQIIKIAQQTEQTNKHTEQTNKQTEQTNKQTEQTNKLANKIVNKQLMKQVTMQTSIQVQTNIKTII